MRLTICDLRLTIDRALVSWPILLAIVPLCWIGLGCTHPCPTTLVGVEQVVGEYNANAAALPKLWTRARIEMTLANDSGRTFTWGSPVGPANGLLLVGKESGNPASPDFVLVGRQTGREIFRMGTSSTDKLYYAWYSVGEEGRSWFGRPDRIGSPQTQEFFADPLGLVSLLGVIELPSDLTRLPTVALSMSRDPCAYVLTYIDRQNVTGKVVFKREIFFNWTRGGPRRPFQVRFFGSDGRRILTAKLADYKEVPGTNVNGSPAVVPTDITMIEEDWPGRKSHLPRLHLTLSEMNVTDGDAREAARFWDNLPAGLKGQEDRLIDVDKPPTTNPSDNPPAPASAPTKDRR